MICLENESLKVWIKPKGAELKSVISKTSQIDHIWNANPFYWAKSSPILFPIVGQLIDDQYIFEGKTYKLPRHGFAREKLFVVEEKTSESVTFLLESDAETLENYPFAFSLRITYVLIGAILNVKYTVRNTGENEMWFSIGGHPAFSVPFEGFGTYNQYYLEFAKKSHLMRWLLNDKGLLTGETEMLALENNRLKLSHELFYNDAIVIKNLASNTIKLANENYEHYLKFSFKNFAAFGIWAAKNAPFVCLEPWNGVADHINHNQNLITKSGIKSLLAGGAFTCEWSTEVG
jgi:galactose mutarotase-like enzyme